MIGEQITAARDLYKFTAPAVVAQQAAIDAAQRASFEAFEAWLARNGAAFPGLKLECYTENVRGVYADVDIPARTRIMHIPLACLITDALARATPLGQKVYALRFALVVPTHSLVIVYILTEMSAARDQRRRAAGPLGCSKTDGGARARKSPDDAAGSGAEESEISFFQPYFDVLPRDLSNFPVYWRDAELELLRGSALHREIAQRNVNIKADFDVLSRKIPELAAYSCWTHADFMWCRTIVASRNFSITVDGVGCTAMVPQADMLNHFRPRETSWTYEQDLGAFTMKSLVNLSGGRQVMDSYGKKCNSRFLLHYGFAVERNVEVDGSSPDMLQIVFTAEQCVALAAELDVARNAELDSRIIDETPEQLGSGAATKQRHAGGDGGSGGSSTGSSSSAADLVDAALAADIAKRSRDRALLDFKLQSLASTKRARLTRGADASDTAGAMAYLRVACATRAELGCARVSGGHGCAVISAANELAALRGLALGCRRYLSLQPRTLAEDCALLERTTPFSNERNALLVTSGEKVSAGR